MDKQHFKIVDLLCQSYHMDDKLSMSLEYQESPCKNSSTNCRLIREIPPLLAKMLEAAGPSETDLMSVICLF